MSTLWRVQWLGAPLVLLATGLIGGGAALAVEKMNWLTGPAFRNKLQQRESVGWSGRPLRDAFEGFPVHNDGDRDRSPEFLEH